MTLPAHIHAKLDSRNRQIAMIADNPEFTAYWIKRKFGTTDISTIAKQWGYLDHDIDAPFIVYEVASNRANFKSLESLEIKRKLPRGTLTDLLDEAPAAKGDKREQPNEDNESRETKSAIYVVGDKLGAL